MLVCDALQHPYLRGELLAHSLEFRAAQDALRRTLRLAAYSPLTRLLRLCRQARPQPPRTFLVLRQSAAKSHSSSKPPSCTAEDLRSLDVSRGASQQRDPEPARASSDLKLLHSAQSLSGLPPPVQAVQSPAMRTSQSRPFLKKAVVAERRLLLDLGEQGLAPPEQSFLTPTASSGFKRRSQQAGEKKAPLAPVAADQALFRPHALRKAPSMPTGAEELAPPSRKPRQKLKVITGSSHSRRDAKATPSLYKISSSSSFNKASKVSLQQAASVDLRSASLARADRSDASGGPREPRDRPLVAPFSRKRAQPDPECTPSKHKPLRSSEPGLFDSASKHPNPSRFLASIQRVLPCDALKDCGRPLFGPLGPASATFYKERIHEHHTREVERKIADRRIRILQSSLAQLEKDSDRLAREDPPSAESPAKKTQL